MLTVAATAPARNWNQNVVVTPTGSHVLGNPAAKVKLTEFAFAAGARGWNVAYGRKDIPPGMNKPSDIAIDVNMGPVEGDAVPGLVTQVGLAAVAAGAGGESLGAAR